MNRENSTSTAKSKPQYAFAANCAFALCMTFSLAACHIPGGKDAENATAIGRFITEKYGRFEDRVSVEKNYQGKIYYNRAGSYPTIYFYEVTDLGDIAAIEGYARESLKVIDVDRINLIFYEKQNMLCVQGHTCARQKEKFIREVAVVR
jgi:hypothetical protein